MRRKNQDAYNDMERYRRIEARMTVLIHYAGGRPRCACCKEGTLQFLCIDHKEGGGNKHRREVNKGMGGHRFYLWLIKNGFPKGYQVLCHNCNYAKSRTGGCPHKWPKPNA